MNQRISSQSLPPLAFLIIWVAFFGFAWFAQATALTIFEVISYWISPVKELADWIKFNTPWLNGVLIGAFIGVVLATVQPWLIRWRYGFVPRFWRLATFFGTLLSASRFWEILYNDSYTPVRNASYQDYIYPDQFTGFFLWFVVLTMIQSLALWPLVRRSWLYSFAGLLAFGFGFAASLFDVGYQSHNPNTTAFLFYGTIAQALLSGMLFIFLMRDYRRDAVPKRSEKRENQSNPNPDSRGFMGLWIMAGMLDSLCLITMMYSSFFGLNPIFHEFGISHSVGDLLFYQFAGFDIQHEALYLYLPAKLLALTIDALLIGMPIALAQAWLMQKIGNYKVPAKLWFLANLTAWIIASLAIGMFNGEAFYGNPYGFRNMLMLWIALPLLAQYLVLRRDLQGAWHYLLAAIFSASLAGTLAFLLRHGYSFMWVLILSSMLRAALTGTAFLKMMGQTMQESPSEAVLTEELATDE